MKYDLENCWTKVVALLIAMLLASPALATSIGIVNGDFDSDPDNTTPPTGWTDATPTSFWVGVADEPGNLSSADAAAAGFSGNFLSTARLSAGAGSQPNDGTLLQTVDLSAFASDVDSGDRQLFVEFDWASGDDRDTGIFSLSFFASSDGSGAALGAGFSQSLDEEDGFNIVSFHESVGGAVPIGTRSVTLQIDTTRSGGSETNLWFDNFAGQIVVPEPASLMLMGIAGLFAKYRRKNP